MKAVIAALVVGVVLISFPAGSNARQPGILPNHAVIVGDGLIKGNEFIEFPEMQKRRYVSGMIDAFLFSPAVGSSAEVYAALAECVRGMTDKQLVAIVSDWLASHPQRWHDSMNSIFFASIIRQTCDIN